MNGGLFRETVASWQDWSRVFQNIPAFTPLAREICRREGFPWHPLSPLTPGTNGVFRSGDLVLKIFFPKESGLDPEPDFLTEKTVCQQVLEWGISTPKLLAQGMICDKYDFHYLITAYSPGKEADDWLASASRPQKERFVERLHALLHGLNRPVDNLFPQEDLKQSARENFRLENLCPTLREELLARLENLSLGDCVLTHGDLTGENLLVQDDGSLTVIDWADAHMAPAWYELGPIMFELFRGNGECWRLFAGKDPQAFSDRLLDCVCLHDFGPDFLIQAAQREGRPPFQNLEEVSAFFQTKFGT